MSRLDSEEASFNDADVESLLQDFFRAEIPAGLRRPAAAPQPASLTVLRGSAAKPETTKSASTAALLAIVAAMLIAVLALQRPMKNQSTSPPDTAVVDSSTAAAPPAVAETPAVTMPVEQRIYDTENGPVEQRKFWKWIELGYIEPETGEKMQWLLPELNIEIIPIEDDEEEKPESSSEDE